VPADDRPRDDEAEKVDLDRRGFFRAFGREALQNAATVAGAVDALRRGTAAATSELLGLGLATPSSSAARLEEARLARIGALGAAPGEAAGGFRSPYRLEEDAIVVLDQRRLPEIVEVRAVNAPEVARLFADRIVNGGPLLAQLAAYGLAYSAERQRRAKPYARNALLRGAANALRNGRPSSVGIGWALDRLTARWESVGELSPGEVVADALRAEADAIASGLTVDLARLGRLAAERLPAPEGRELHVLVHGPVGALSAGMVGAGLSVIQALVADGRGVHVYIPVGGLARSGERVTAWELARGDVPSTVVPDAALGSLVEEVAIDAVLVAPERVAADGSVLAAAGTYPLALLAARQGIPFYVCTHSALVDLQAGSAERVPADAHTGAELRIVGSLPVKPDPVVLRATDVTPADLVRRFLTEEGLVGAPFPSGLAAAVAAGAARRPSLPEPPADRGQRREPTPVEA
jgi:methylthioribose-1-phosphate isomerase